MDRNIYWDTDSCKFQGSPSSRRAWIEIIVELNPVGVDASPSSRRAWIEILKWAVDADIRVTVALLAEGVDRNPGAQRIEDGIQVVALLAEGVDRNYAYQCHAHFMAVALLAEGVDRNTLAL